MSTPQARLRLEGADVLILGTVAGFVPDGPRVRQAFDAFLPDVVALGVPLEDIAGLDALAGTAPRPDLPEPDDATLRLLELLEPFGGTRIPSPDFEVAHAAARAAAVPLEALDLDDATHAALFTKKVKFHHVLQSNVIKARLLKKGVGGADAYEIAMAWDAVWNRPKGLQRVESAREEHLAMRLREATRGHARVLVVVAAARLAGLVRALGNVDDAAPARTS